MVVIDSHSERGYIRETCFPFEGFLECLVRIATLKALPSEAELSDGRTGVDGAIDAGSYLLSLRFGANPQMCECEATAFPPLHASQHAA